MHRSKTHRVVESASCSKSVEAGCEYQDQIGKSECVSQVEMATSFSKFYPRVAHQRVSQLGRATSFFNFYPCMAHKRVSQVEMAIYPCITKG